MKKVILINPFEVPEGNKEKCISFWEKAAEYTRKQLGFISTRLHRALSPGTRFYLINIAEWESPEHFQAAIQSDEFQSLIKPYMDIRPTFPRIVRDNKDMMNSPACNLYSLEPNGSSYCIQA